jgi:hypothetical protein
MTDLTKLRDEKAEKYFANVDGNCDSDKAFDAGFDSALQALAEMDHRFDEATVSNEAIVQMKLGVAIDSAYIRGARWQHDQSRLKLAALQTLVKDHEDDWKRIQDAEREVERLRRALETISVSPRWPSITASNETIYHTYGLSTIDVAKKALEKP